jgi:hypothetical protein
MQNRGPGYIREAPEATLQEVRILRGHSILDEPQRHACAQLLDGSVMVIGATGMKRRLNGILNAVDHAGRV